MNNTIVLFITICTIYYRFIYVQYKCTSINSYIVVKAGQFHQNISTDMRFDMCSVDTLHTANLQQHFLQADNVGSIETIKNTTLNYYMKTSRTTNNI